MGIRLLVCGGRDFTDYARARHVLDQLEGSQGPVDTVIHGAARGADSLADRWARERGKDLAVYPADWNRFGKSAGPRRNQRMLEEGRPTLALALPGGRGTADMVQRLEAAGIRVLKE